MTARDKHWLLVLILLLSLAASGMVAGCGKSTNESTEAPRGSRSKPHVRGRLMFPLPLSKKDRKQGCVWATSSLDHDPRLIDITAHCIGHSNGGLIFISRYAIGNPTVEPRIAAFTRKPRVRNHGSELRRGQCDREKAAISCAVSAVNSSRMKFKIWVPPHTRCSAGVSVVMRRSDACSPEPCVGGVIVYSLFRGRPRGC